MIARGLIIDGIEFVRKCLLDVNYYRLRGFWLSLESNDRFLPDTTFMDVWDIYCFDEELRSLLQSAICPLEIRVRTQYSYYLSQRYGPDAHINPKLFKDQKRFNEMLSDYNREKAFSYENGVPCVVHNLDKYGELPIWAAVEILSFGKVLKSLKNLKTPEDQKTILKSFNHKKYYIQSWLDMNRKVFLVKQHGMSTLRNISPVHLLCKRLLTQENRRMPNSFGSLFEVSFLPWFRKEILI